MEWPGRWSVPTLWDIRGFQSHLLHMRYNPVSLELLPGGRGCELVPLQLPRSLRRDPGVPSRSNRHIRLLEIGVLAWTLWTVRNNLVIQRIPLRRASDAVFKLCGYLQLWRPLSHPQNQDTISSFIGDLRQMALCLAPPLPPPPHEPD